MNIVILVVVVCAYLLAIRYFLFSKSNGDIENFEDESADRFSEEYLSSNIVDLIDDILQTDYASLNLNKYEQLKCERNRDRLRLSLKTCACGDKQAKSSVKDFIADLLQRKLDVTEETIDNIIPFNNTSKLTVHDKFEMLLYYYWKNYKDEAFTMFVVRNALDKPLGGGAAKHFAIVDDNINDTFLRQYDKIKEFTFYDKLSIVTQRIYQRTFGLGVFDMIRDMNIDGANAGTSGIPDNFYLDGSIGKSITSPADSSLPLYSYNSLWVMFHGVLISMRCIGFGSQRELMRVCKLIYRYGNPGALDAAHPYMVNYTKDGCRITVARPNMAESWMFFLRKFGTAPRAMQEMYPYNGVEKFIELVQWLVLGDRNIGVTGGQGCGKTSFIKTMIGFCRATEAIRVQEMAFELMLRATYPYLNIATFAETTDVTAEEEIEFSRKTDGTASVFGEIAQGRVASIVAQMGQVGAGKLYYTNHANTTRDMIEYFRDGMIENSGYNNEVLVERMISRILNFDIHLKRVGNMRFPERVTMVVPITGTDYPTDMNEAKREYYYRQTDRNSFETIDVMRFEDDKFVFCNPFTDSVKEAIEQSLLKTEVVAFREFVANMEKEIKGGDTYGI